MIWPDPTINPPTHPPTHQTMHPPMGGGVSTDFKSSNRIEISWLVQVLLNFYWFWGSPPWGVGVWGCGVVWGCPPHMCTHTCRHAHTCARMYDIIGNPRNFPKSNGGSRLQLKLSCLTCICACACVCVCVCMCTCVEGTPNHPTPPSTHPPEPQGAQNTKIQ